MAKRGRPRKNKTPKLDPLFEGGAPIRTGKKGPDVPEDNLDRLAKQVDKRHPNRDLAFGGKEI